MVLLRGQFDMTRLEAVARSAGATVSDYAGTRVVRIAAGDVGALAMAALEPGLVAVGDLATVHRSLDELAVGSDVTVNAEMMARLDRVERDSHAWAVGRFGDLSALGILPADVSNQMPAVTTFALSGRIDSEVRASVSIEGRDEEAGQHLRDLARAQSQTTGRAELQALIDSVQLTGTGTTATLSFRLPSEALDLILSAEAP